MFEKVNPNHPDKVADRIAGAVVDIAYKQYENPHIAVEVLIGHGICYVMIESDVKINLLLVKKAIHRITGDHNVRTEITFRDQDVHLSENQKDKVRCGDNGIFKGMPVTTEQKILTEHAADIYTDFGSDGKYILDWENHKITICQSGTDEDDDLNITALFKRDYSDVLVNPLGQWTGGPYVDTGATNRKLGSDMGDSVTGGGLHGKDLSKADVSINIYAFLKAQNTLKPVELSCSIGDEYVDGKPYEEIVEIAKNYINQIGGFEKFAEWGLIRP